MMQPAEFWDACDGFDWYFEYSDDHRVWRNGTDRRAQLVADAPAGSENRKIFDGFQQHHFSGEAFGTKKIDKPEKPKS